MRHPHPLQNELLQRLSTQRLLKVLKVARVHWLELWSGSTDIPDWDAHPRRAWESQAAYEKRVADAEANWNRRKAEADKYEKDIKDILATREHIPRKKRAA